ncbi:MAG TPA: DUF4214 domain-containing protein [Telluria sp.]|jgi:hypothetical protein
MTYPTIDTLPDLSPNKMAGAAPLKFESIYDNNSAPRWDVGAQFHSASAGFVADVFHFSGVEGGTYDIHSFNAREATMLKLYDQFGNAVATGRDPATTSFGQDALTHFVAPYSGTYYIGTGWIEIMVEPFNNVSIYGNLGAAAPTTNERNGGAGDNIYSATDRSDIYDGGAGYDTVYYTGDRADYNIVEHDGVLTVTSRHIHAGTDQLRGFELIKFDDASIDLPYAALAQALYVGYFGRAADVGGLASFQAQLAAMGAPSSLNALGAMYGSDARVRTLIDSFGASSESQALYTGDNQAFVKAIYRNVLNRDADQAGLDFWSHAIDAGSLTRANASLSIMAGAKSNGSPQGLADATLVDAKISVASNFTYALESTGVGATYAGAGAAGIARGLLGSVNPASDVNDVQTAINQAIVRLSLLPRSPFAHAGDAPQAQPDLPPIVLAGIDASHGPGAWAA